MNGQPFQLADRLFGRPAHLVLVNDSGPAVSMLGWRLGSGHVQCKDSDGSSRNVTIEILYSDAGEYAVTERSEQRLADGASRLDAVVTLFTVPRDVRRFCESSLGDPVRDMALAGALDHAMRIWPWFDLGGRRSGQTRAHSAAI